MGFFTKLSNGWKLAIAGFGVIKKNKQLLLFPVISGAALIVTTGSFIIIFLAGLGWETGHVVERSTAGDYVLTFIFYLINYFIIIFFNMGLIHCARLYFAGEEVTLGKGIAFSMSRIKDILAWSVLAATVGLIFKLIEEYFGRVGQLISGLLGMVWSIATFFAVPVIAYEKVGPIEALKRSSQIMKEKWGESIGATFSFGIIRILGILLIAVPLFFLGSTLNLFVGIALGAIAAFLVFAVVSAAEMIFVSAVYQHMNNIPVTDFDVNTLDAVFISK